MSRTSILCAASLLALLATPRADAGDHLFTKVSLDPALADVTDLAAGHLYSRDFAMDMVFVVPEIGVFGNPNFDVMSAQSFEGGPPGAREIETYGSMASTGLDAFVTLGADGLHTIEWNAVTETLVTEELETKLSPGGSDLRIGDVDNDGTVDVMCLSSAGNSILRFQDKKMASIAPLPEGQIATELEILDLDNEGGLDLAVLTGDYILGIVGIGTPGAVGGVIEVLHAFGSDWAGSHICVTQHPARSYESVAFVADPTDAQGYYSLLGTADLQHYWAGTIVAPHQTASIDSVDLDPSLDNGNEILLNGTSGISALVLAVGDPLDVTSVLYDSALGEGVGYILHPVGPSALIARPIVGDFDRDGDEDAVAILNASNQLAYLRSQEVKDSDVNMTTVPSMYVAASESSRQAWCRPSDSTDPLDYLGLRFWRPEVDVLPGANGLEVVIYRRVYPGAIERIPWHYSIYNLPPNFFTSGGVPEWVDPHYYYYTTDEDVAVCVPVTECFSDPNYPVTESYHVMARLIKRNSQGGVVDAGPMTMQVLTNDPVLTAQYAYEYKLAYGVDGMLADIFIDVGGAGAGAQTGSGSAEPISQGPFPVPPPRGIPTGGTTPP